MRKTRATFMLILGLLTVSGTAAAASDGSTSGSRPFRVAVIIGDQWDDPMSYMVTAPKPTGEYSEYYDKKPFHKSIFA